MEPWQHQFRNKMADGEICFDDGDFGGARLYFQDAFRLIPEPKQNHGEATQAIGALADCFYSLEDFAKAQAALDDVLLCPGGAANPFLRLRRGQVLQRTGNPEKARTELTAAYLNGGLEVFQGEEEFLTLIADVIAELSNK